MARRPSVDAVLVDRADYGGFGAGFDRQGYTQAVADALVAAGVDVVVMAGFGTVLDQPVHDAFPGRILNTHPALLPAFPGWHAVRDALAAGVRRRARPCTWPTWRWTRARSSPRPRCPSLPGDTEATLHERIKAVERTLYPATIRSFIDDLASRAVGGGSGSPEEVTE